MGKTAMLLPWRQKLLHLSVKDQVRQRRYLLSPRWMAGEMLKRIRTIKNPGPEPQQLQMNLHTNAAGDFLLMAAEAWTSLRGFPELTTHSHIDSYMVYQAAISGLRQVILRAPIYHQEHDRSEQSARPLTVLEEIPAVKRMLETRRLEITNNSEWGLANTGLGVVEVGGSAAMALGQL